MAAKKYVLSFEALVEARSPGDAENQRQALKNALGNPALKMMLEQLGIKLVGYKVLTEIKEFKP